MTLEEKISHLQTTSMEQARAEGNAIIDSHKEALEKVFEDHKTEARDRHTPSAEDFIGGVRAVIRSRNVLIDNSFKTQLRNEYDKFLFLGGDGIA